MEGRGNLLNHACCYLDVIINENSECIREHLERGMTDEERREQEQETVEQGISLLYIQCLLRNNHKFRGSF